MAKVTVEKCINGKRETMFSPPALLLRLAGALLPRAAVSALVQKGLNLPEILLAIQRGERYKASMNVVEKGIRKTVIVSVD